MINIGDTLTQERTTTPADSAVAMTSGGMNVYSTPSMIAFMENTAFRLAQSKLESGETTVGIHLSIDHVKATKIGAKVTCTARLTGIDGKKLVFEIEASDEAGLIGKGTHHRFIVNEAKFMSKLN